MNERIKEKIVNISLQEDFDKFIENVKLSTAPIEVREEIIEFSNKMHPTFSGIDPFEEVKLDIEESQADMDDIIQG